MLLIENGYVIDPKSETEGNFDLLIQDGIIMKMRPKLRNHLTDAQLADCKVIDAQGLLIGPGLVDIHVHFRDPGFPEKEDIDSGTKAAAAGGYTTVVMMANTHPVLDSPDIIKDICQKSFSTPIHTYLCGAVTKGLLGMELTDMQALQIAGAIGFSDDGKAICSKETLQKALIMAAQLDMPISLHEEDPSMIKQNGIHHGKASDFFQIEGSPREAEISMIARDLELAAKFPATLNIQHISTKEGVELVRRAKRKGLRVHAEATPHHFSLTQDDLIRYGSMAKINPPLREASDRFAIITGIIDGTIDLIATDHAPHTLSEKERSLTDAPSGMIGLETALALGLTELVNQGYLTVKTLLQKMSTNPANLYHLDAGYLEEGGPADLILVDTTAVWQPETYHSRSSNTPFTGRTLQGSVVMTICGGNIVYTKEIV